MGVKKKVIIAGAAGRDYHNFLVFFKDNPEYEVIAFTASQIPGIEKRTFPKQLAGRLYKKDIPIFPETELVSLIKKFQIDEVVLSYSDLSYDFVGHFLSKVLSAGASFRLLSPKQTQLTSKKPVISVCAVRTGCGKSQTSRKVLEFLSRHGFRVGVVRHPMPYGNLLKQRVQKFSKFSDFKKHEATIEEQEEYTKYIELGFSVYAGVDYAAILKLVERENDIVLWDGGNNDFSFYKPDLEIVVVDPHRAGHEVSYYPGEVNFLSARVIIINKIDSAKKSDIKTVENNIKKFNPKAVVVKARSEITVSSPEKINGKRCLIVGDGPTLTHGGMGFGAGTLAVRKFGGKIVSPKPFSVGSIKKTFQKFPHLKLELPAMGYNSKQIKELENTINRAKCDVVIDGTPANLSKILKINKPIVNVEYELDEVGDKFEKVLQNFIKTSCRRNL